MSRNVRIRALLLVVMLGGGAAGCFWFAPPRNGVVYIAVRPPGDRVEVIPAAPGVGFVWIRGWWMYRGTDFIWVPGRWDRPAEGRKEWVAHHWAHDSHGWYLVEGHWR
jgi:hypothetical protein